jgi:hypothetical protein
MAPFVCGTAVYVLCPAPPPIDRFALGGSIARAPAVIFWTRMLHEGGFHPEKQFLARFDSV